MKWSVVVMDEQERHFIGDLLSDDDVFSAPPNRSSTTPSLGGPIGPPPGGKFWPEPPPPYSPNPPQWAELKQGTGVGISYVYGADGRPMATSGPSIAGETPHMFVPNMEGAKCSQMSGLQSAQSYASYVPPPQAYRTPQGRFPGVMIPPGSAPPHMANKGFESGWDSVYTPFGPVRSSVGDVTLQQQQHVAVGDVSLQEQKDAVAAAAAFAVHNNYNNTIAQQHQQNVHRLMRLGSNSSPALQPSGGAKTYSDVASNKNTTKRTVDSSIATSGQRLMDDNQRHSSSTDSQSDSGSNAQPMSINSKYGLDDFEVTELGNNDAAVTVTGLLEKNINQNSNNLSLKSVTTNTNENGGEFQQITRKRGGRGDKNGKTQIASQKQIINERFRFQVLATGAQTASPTRREEKSFDFNKTQSNNPSERREKLNNDNLIEAEYRGKSPQNRKTSTYINNNLSAADQDDSPEVDIARESKSVGLTPVRRVQSKSSKKGRRENSDAAERRRKLKKQGKGLWIWISFIFWTCLGYIQFGGRWLRDLVTDIGCQLWDIIVHLSRETYTKVCSGVQRGWHRIGERLRNLLIGLRQRRWWSFSWWKTRNKTENTWGLEENIGLPSTGEEAMQRLLSCRGQDAYSILGLKADCTDDEIKKYYKRQAVLVHPDKNTSYGADEAFKILAHAFECIGTVEHRRSYNIENIQRSKAMQELEELMNKLRQKMEEALSSMHCDCGNKHRRFATKRSSSEARYCRRCKEFHPARENDIWAESRWWGFLWYYYACMDNVIYDITEWAGCPKNLLKHMKANSHNVQYRLISAKNTLSSSGRPATNARQPSEAEIEELLNRFLDDNKRGGSGQGGQGNGDTGSASQCASYRPPERPTGDSRPRKAGRRRKMK